MTAYLDTAYFQGAQGIIIVTAYLDTVYFQGAQGIIVMTAYLDSVFPGGTRNYRNDCILGQCISRGHKELS